jgi:hypothetical protein
MPVNALPSVGPGRYAAGIIEEDKAILDRLAR